MSTKRIVITGGPSTGKTSLINALEKSGYFCFPEVIRLMTLEAKEKGKLSSLTTNPIASISDPMAFNQKIITARLAQFQEAATMGIPFVFYDRGIPDVLAYMDYFEQEYGQDFSDKAMNNKYDTVFLLPIWKEIYISDNGRFESYVEALQIHKQLHITYTYLGYKVIEVPPDSIKNRIEFVLKHL